MNLILIDSNILIYAINRASPKHRQAQEYLRKNLSDLCIAHQNILETIRVLTHPKFASPMTPDAAVVAVMAVADNARIIAPDLAAIYVLQEFVRKHSLSGDKIFDAYLAATAMTAGVSTIATDNTKDFKNFSAVTVLNPFTAQ